MATDESNPSVGMLRLTPAAKKSRALNWNHICDWIRRYIDRLECGSEFTAVELVQRIGFHERVWEGDPSISMMLVQQVSRLVKLIDDPSIEFVHHNDAEWKWRKRAVEHTSELGEKQRRQQANRRCVRFVASQNEMFVCEGCGKLGSLADHAKRWKHGYCSQECNDAFDKRHWERCFEGCKHDPVELSNLQKLKADMDEWKAKMNNSESVPVVDTK